MVHEEGETAVWNKRLRSAECVEFREPGEGFQGQPRGLFPRKTGVPGTEVLLERMAGSVSLGVW